MTKGKLASTHRGSRGIGSVLERVRIGVAWGVGLALVFCIYVIGLYILRGSEPFERVGSSLGKTLLAYLAGGVAGGAIVGVLFPFTRHWFGRSVVGILAAFAASLGIGMAMFGPPTGWMASHWFATSISAVFFGVLGAYLFSRPLT